jgi:hypothetical protein
MKPQQSTSYIGQRVVSEEKDYTDGNFNNIPAQAIKNNKKSIPSTYQVPGPSQAYGGPHHISQTVQKPLRRQSE